MLRVQNAAPLAEVERYSEVQVSNPHIGVQHLKNGIAYVFVGHLEGAAVPDSGEEIRAALDALLVEYRDAERTEPATPEDLLERAAFALGQARQLLDGIMARRARRNGGAA